MRIAIDARAWQWTGIGRYIRSLLTAYVALKPEHEFVILAPRGQEEALQEAVPLAGDAFEIQSVEPSYYSWAEQTIFAKELRGIKADLFHFTHFNMPIRFSRPYVVTIHDTTRFVFPGQKRQRLLEQVAYEYVFSRAVNRAKAVLAVSEYTLQELTRLPIQVPSNVAVTHEGVDAAFLNEVAALDRQKIRTLIETQNEFLLSVGVWMSHKNLHRLLEAFALVLKKHPDVKLVITGKPVPRYSNVLKKTTELGLEDSVIFPGFVPHHLLPALYAEAKAFVFPSLYEGFGLPALEAAAVGTPVVASNVTSVPEIMGEAAVYVNPEYVPSIARGMEKILSDDELHKNLSSVGRTHAEQFRWEDCAQKTLSVYDSVLA